MKFPLDIKPNSPCDIVARNYGFSIQEVGDIGALLLFLHASTIHGIVSDYRITACDGFARVETRGECTGIWEDPEMLKALEKAMAAILLHTKKTLS